MSLSFSAYQSLFTSLQDKRINKGLTSKKNGLVILVADCICVVDLFGDNEHICFVSFRLIFNPGLLFRVIIPKNRRMDSISNCILYSIDIGLQTPPYISSSVPKEWVQLMLLLGPESASILNPDTASHLGKLL